ncbi:MAG: CpsD/CapB family tyrosine-protein kinase [Clostridiaceae bacterium]|nr:CpsD/CapB family tyrosine-protein kinase [Clostridiaceae bacterium]
MFIVEKEPKSITAEAYRTLRTNIQYSSFDKEIRSIVVTSSEPGEGKSTVTGNLALSFAQDDKSVILIDCDLRRPTVYKNFRLSNQVGLSEVIVGKAKVEDAIQVYNENLHILTSGKIPPNPAEMLSSNMMTKLINALKEKYDMVILDSAPLQAVTDAQILSTKVDGTVFVVRAERTKIDSVKEAKSLLDKVGANIIGTVLHATSQSKGKYYYYYGTDEEVRKRRRR